MLTAAEAFTVARRKLDYQRALDAVFLRTLLGQIHTRALMGHTSLVFEVRTLQLHLPARYPRQTAVFLKQSVESLGYAAEVLFGTFVYVSWRPAVK